MVLAFGARDRGFESLIAHHFSIFLADFLNGMISFPYIPTEYHREFKILNLVGKNEINHRKKAILFELR